MSLDPAILANANGWIQLDLRMHSSVTNPGVRQGLLQTFTTRMQQLTDLNDMAGLGGLARYLSVGITDPNHHDNGNHIPGIPMEVPAS